MKKSVKIIVSMMLVCCMVFMMTACGNKPADVADTFEAEVQTAGKIVIGTSPDYPPFESLNAAGELEGFEIDLMNEIIPMLKTADGKSYEIQWSQMDFSTIIAALQSGQIDLGVSGFTYNPERKCLFSTPYLDSSQVAVVLKDSGIETLDDLKGKNIAAGMGTTGEDAAKEIEGATVTSPGDYLIMFEALKNQVIDVVVCDSAVGEEYAATNDLFVIPEPLINEETSVIVAEGNDRLIAEINSKIEEFMKTEKFEELLEKWGLG